MTFIILMSSPQWHTTIVFFECAEGYKIHLRKDVLDSLEKTYNSKPEKITPMQEELYWITFYSQSYQHNVVMSLNIASRSSVASTF